MNEQQRREAFAKAMDAIQAQYGIQVSVSLQTKQYGAMLQVEPTITLEIVDSYQEHTLSEVKNAGEKDHAN